MFKQKAERVFWSPTDDDPDFPALVIQATGHHGSYSVMYNCHDICIIVLETIYFPLDPQHSLLQDIFLFALR